MRRVISIEISIPELQAIVQEAVNSAIQDYDFQRERHDMSVALFSRNEVAKRLQIGHNSVNVLIETGHLRVTPDGKKVIGQSVLEYSRTVNKHSRKP